MSTRVIGAGRRARIWAALVALALTVAVLVVAIQASSIWSAKTGSQVRPVPALTAPSANPAWTSGYIATSGCRRPKWGCQHRLRTSSHIRIGCRRPKYGCQQSGSATAERP
jgi:hypothetical protein